MQRTLWAEKFVDSFSSRPLTAECVFHSPQYVDRGKQKEVCDFLLVLRSNAILVSMKSQDDPSSRTGDKLWRWTIKNATTALNQARGALNTIAREPFWCQHSRRGRVDFKQGSIRVAHVLVLTEVFDDAVELPDELPLLLDSVPVTYLSLNDFLNLINELRAFPDIAAYLLRDLRESFALPEQGFPSKLHPWQARVADLGWADIWCQGGGTYHAWRPYLAPERFRNTVVPEASDIYAFGIIACELLSGVHPGGDRTELLAKRWKQNKWEAWAASTNRVVDVKPPGLRDLILRCLRPNPSSRPRANDLKAALCDILENTHGLKVASQLQVQDEQARALMLASHDAWPAEEMSRVGPGQLDTSIAQLETNLSELCDACSTEQIAKSLTRSRSLQRLLLRRKQPGDLERRARLASAALDLILERFKELDLREEIYGRPVIADLKPEEVSWEFATEAFKNLKQATGVDETQLKSYQVRLQSLYSEACREAAEAFTSEVLGKNSNR